MKQQLNEIKRMQQLAGLIVETKVGPKSKIPTIVKVEKQSFPLLASGGEDLVLTLSNGKRVSISSGELNGIYGNEVDHPEEVVGSLWEQPPYVDFD